MFKNAISARVGWMKYWIIVFLFFLGELNAQNLIPDPYFDIIKDCRTQPYLDFFQYWFNPTSSKRNRAFHPCLDNIPYNPYGTNHYKYPKAGSGMLTIMTYYDLENNHRSYIVGKLKSTLEQKTSYYIRFFVSPKKYQNSSRNMVADNIGIYLNSKKVQQDILTTLPFTAQIERRGTFFEDYNKWYKVQGKYIAKGEEKYAVIGNFRSDNETHFKYTNPSSGSVPNIAELFIDDVLIEAFNPLPDTLLLCDRQPLNLNAGFHDATYEWNTGERDSVITVNRSGKYKVLAMIDTLEFQDSTQVIFMDDFTPENTIDTFFCQDGELVLRSPVPGNHRWSNGAGTSTLSVQDAGTYRLSVDNKCGTYEFTYNVTKRDCNCDLVLPSAFTPNGDRQNDIFTVIDQCRYREWILGSFQVYDKWGGMIYQENRQMVSWNGQSSDGRELPPGVYTYRLEAIIQHGAEEEFIVKTGSVHLLR